jgi:hypothetical protein
MLYMSHRKCYKISSDQSTLHLSSKISFCAWTTIRNFETIFLFPPSNHVTLFIYEVSNFIQVTNIWCLSINFFEPSTSEYISCSSQKIHFCRPRCPILITVLNSDRYEVTDLILILHVISVSTKFHTEEWNTTITFTTTTTTNNSSSARSSSSSSSSNSM